MKRFFYTALALVMVFASCKKEKKDTTTNSHPADKLSLLQDVPAGAVSTNGIDGSLQAVKQVFITIQGSDTVIRRQEQGYANFLPGGQHVFANAGDVSLNNMALALQTSPAGGVYYSTVLYDSASPGSFDLDSGNLWNVSGNEVIAALSYNYSGAFPDYTGTLPLTVNKASGLSLIIDTNLVHNADSVFIIIADNANKVVYKNVPARAGTVWFTPGELGALSSSALQSSPKAWLKMIPYSYTVGDYGGKNFAFVKEREIWQAIAIE